MKIAVLGATGLLGHHCARAIRQAGHELVVIHRSSSRIERLAYLQPQFRAAELLDRQALLRSLDGLDGVVFCAGYYPVLSRRWQGELASALDQTRQFYGACRQAGVPRIVYVGSAIALPVHPDGLPGHEGLFYDGLPRWKNPYLLSKWALDEQARSQARAGLPVVIGIPSMTLGEFDFGPSTGKLITSLGNARMTHYVPGRRNVIAAADAGRGLLRTLESGRVGERYLLTGCNIDMADLTARIAERVGVTPPKALPVPLAKWVARLGILRHRLGGRAPLLDDTAIAVMAGGQFLDGRKAHDELGFVAENGLDPLLDRAIAWFRENGYMP